MPRRRAWLMLPMLLIPAACHRRLPAAPPRPAIRYVLESSYQAGGIWYYPQENFAFDATGIATVGDGLHGDLTADNEPYDSAAMAAAMQTIQLPAIATVTNLENGRMVRLRVNDRGPDTPTRLIAVTPHVAALLAMRGPIRVRVQLDPALSAALAHQTRGAAGDLAISTAPRSDVQQTTLAPLAGTGQEATRAVAGPQSLQQVGEQAEATVPLHLPDQVIQGDPDPGVLMIDAGSFSHDSAAYRRLSVLRDEGARLQRTRSGGVTTLNIVIGPFADIPQADATLDRLVADGITDARITVDLQ